MNISRITLTGADDTVKPEDLQKISKKYDYVEWAILFSQSKTGLPRYPSWDWVVDLTNLVENSNELENFVYLAAHLCGKWVDDIMGGNFTFLEYPVSQYFNRIQLNMGKDRLRQCMTNKKFLDAIVTKHNFPQIILGGNYSHIQTSGSFFLENNLIPLFDASGGRGVKTKEWPMPFPELTSTGFHFEQGYAGGLGPDNIVEELKRIEDVVGKDDSANDYMIWLDMETGIRSDDGERFDLEKCEQVLEAVKPWME